MYQSQNVEPDKFRQAVINFNEFTFLSTSEKELIKHNPELLQKFWQFLILLNRNPGKYGEIYIEQHFHRMVNNWKEELIKMLYWLTPEQLIEVKKEENYNLLNKLAIYLRAINAKHEITPGVYTEKKMKDYTVKLFDIIKKVKKLKDISKPSSKMTQQEASLEIGGEASERMVPIRIREFLSMEQQLKLLEDDGFMRVVLKDFDEGINLLVAGGVNSRPNVNTLAQEIYKKNLLLKLNSEKKLKSNENTNKYINFKLEYVDGIITKEQLNTLKVNEKWYETYSKKFESDINKFYELIDNKIVPKEGAKTTLKDFENGIPVLYKIYYNGWITEKKK